MNLAQLLRQSRDKPLTVLDVVGILAVGVALFLTARNGAEAINAEAWRAYTARIVAERRRCDRVRAIRIKRSRSGTR